MAGIAPLKRLAASGLLALALATSAATSASDGAGNAVRRAVVHGSTTPVAGERHALRLLYEPVGYAPLWLDAAGRPNPDAQDALAMLSQAQRDGLDAVDYRAALTAAAQGENVEDAVAHGDVRLSAAVLRYLRHLHRGRIEPRTLGMRLPPPRDDAPALAAALRDALAAHRVELAADRVAPPLEQYRQLRAMLARYRAMATDASLATPMPLAATPLRPGQPYPALERLGQRLSALGDLRSPAPPSVTYDPPLVDAVRRFQRRHGLAQDGVLGQATLAALNVAPARRVQQIELALERLRWLPDLGERRTVAINIPMFRLWAWDPADAAGTSPLGMGVIVGRALDTQTPVFADEMSHVIFRPYWNVPRSIVRSEILPALASNPAYLPRNDMEIVRGAGDDATPVAATAENIALLAQGALRLRQRPGPRNSLGLVKFVFPNDANVYLHGTPAQALFARSRRDFSHGCVRVEDPVALAQWVLKDLPGWSRDRIEAAMAADRPQRVDLPQAVQVILFYTTAVAMPGGEVHFADDIYRHDERLARALHATDSRR
jgi:murein L,D-transpeptidase YcbB/YkuD